MRDPNVKKLTLSKETLMTLQTDDLENVVSGAQRPAPRPGGPRPNTRGVGCVVTVSVNWCTIVYEGGKWVASQLFCGNGGNQQPPQGANPQQDTSATGCR